MLSELDLVLPETGAPDRIVKPVSRPAGRSARAATGTLLAVAACLVLGLPVLGLPLGYRTMIVAGGSMEPFADVGDALVLRRTNPERIQAGAVISFTPLAGHGVVTHRVTREVRVRGVVHFQTQGDANATADANLVPAANVLGTVALRVPKLGAFYAYATSVPGRVVLIILPALVIAWLELRELLPLRRRTFNPKTRWRSSMTAVTLILGAIIGFAAPAAGVFVETNSIPSNSFATSSVNAPTLNSAVGGSAGLLNCKVTLGWTIPGTGLNPDGFDIYRSTTSGGPYSFVQHVGTVTTFVNSGLAQNTTYYFVLQSSFSSWRSGNSNQRSATTPLLCL